VKGEDQALTLMVLRETFILQKEGKDLVALGG